MATLMQASAQWATRPADERYISLHDMKAHFDKVQHESQAKVVSSRSLRVVPNEDHKRLAVAGGQGIGFEPTHWSFGQLSTLVGAPAGYLRTLPAEVAADNLNWGLHKREVEDVGILLQSNGTRTLRAVTGPNYGRIWNSKLTQELIDKFGDGVTGDWKVPGEFGKDVIVTKANTTLYASDRDMFVFLADEHNRIEVPNRRDGKTGTLARGFFVWNSEVGGKSFGIAAFLFDYVCCNRMVWGAEYLGELTMRHTSKAPDRFIEEATPVLQAYADGSAKPVQEAIAAAQKARIDNVDDFLANRFGPRIAPQFKAIHEAEEGRPIETIWDASVAVTAYARSIEHTDARVDMERKGGALLALTGGKG